MTQKEEKDYYIVVDMPSGLRLSWRERDYFVSEANLGKEPAIIRHRGPVWTIAAVVPKDALLRLHVAEEFG